MTVQELIDMIDRRADDLMFTWKEPGKPESPLSPEIKQALFELCWVRSELETIQSDGT